MQGVDCVGEECRHVIPGGEYKVSSKPGTEVCKL